MDALAAPVVRLESPLHATGSLLSNTTAVKPGGAQPPSIGAGSPQRQAAAVKNQLDPVLSTLVDKIVEIHLAAHAWIA